MYVYEYIICCGCSLYVHIHWLIVRVVLLFVRACVHIRTFENSRWNVYAWRQQSETIGHLFRIDALYTNDIYEWWLPFDLHFGCWRGGFLNLFFFNIAFLFYC